MKKSRKGITAALLSAAVAITSLPINAMGMPMMRLALDEESGGAETQMVSEKTLVYVSSYNGEVRSQNFNENWKFFLGDAGNAQEISFDDSRWRSLNLPHDYSIEQEYSKNMEAESGYLPGGIGWYRKNFTLPASAANQQVRLDFDGVYMNASVYINGKKLGTHPYGYSPFSFDLTPHLNFGGDNVVAVKVNHQTPSSRWYSGSGIYRDVKLTMTPMVHEGLYGTKVSTPDLERKHSGGVLVHVETDIQNECAGEKEVTVSYSVYKKDDESKTALGAGTAEPVMVQAGTSETVTAELTVDSPTLWTLDNPELYVVETTIASDDGSMDITESDFGFRYYRFDKDNGFSLNGEQMKLKGVCMHHDQGSLGASAYERAIERQVEILQDMGCNAIRVTHNPAAKTLIDICNRKGMLVIEELFDGWHGAKNGNNEDYAKWYNTAVESGNQILGRTKENMTWAEFDLRSVIRRDYNAPSVISWSLGNEIMEGIVIGVGGYPAEGRKLLGWASDEDATRPITFGDNKLKGNLAQSIEIAEALAAAGGMVGFNYTTLEQLDSFHARYPEWPIYGSETASSINSRGVYNPSLYDRQLTSYDESKVNWGHFASQAWFDTIRKDYVAGEFVWTGFDYIGEPTNWNGINSGAVGAWPSPKNSYFGIIDTAGFPKDSYYLYRSLWNEEEHTVHILPAWNDEVVAKNGNNEVNVVVYSDASSVELFFSPQGSTEQRSLGEKKFTVLNSKNGASDGNYTYQMDLDGEGGSSNFRNLYRTWKVPYADGTLTAVAKDANGNVIGGDGRSQVTTAGKAARLEMQADRTSILADNRDLCYLSVDVTDENGTLVPNAENRVTFTVEGDGELIGVDNGWTTDHDSYQRNNRRAFSGKVLAIVRATREAGAFTVTASAQGLDSASVTVSTEAAGEEQPVPENGIVSYEISKNYYVKTGYAPMLPDTLTAYLADGTAQEYPVVWENIAPEQIEKEGSFVLTGNMEGAVVSVSINMMNQVAAVLNYSTTVHVGEKPILPESRQIVGSDGTILNIALPVEWEETNASDYDTLGIVTVYGTVSVFGETMEVSASVRVQEEKAELTSNVATKAKVTQNIPENLTSDTLEAINNGSIQSEERQDAQWRNLSRWSNWDYTNKQGNEPPAELTFIYATQETLGQAKVYFVENSVDLKNPDAGATKWYISNDMEEWIPLETRETIAEEPASQYVTCYTYDFAPVKATYVKLEIHNSKLASVPSGKKATTGITEVELYRSEGRFAAGSKTGLSQLNLNGVEVNEGLLADSVYKTPMTVVEEISAVGKDNAAVTILPASENQVIMITEAEDHSARENFIIQLGADSVLGPDDASMDYAVENMRVDSVSSEETQSEDTPAVRVLDGNTGSFWHSKWSGGYVDNERWIILKLEENTKLEALRYLPRQNADNGRVNEYRVEVSEDKKEWTTVSGGNWTNDSGWKLAAFEKPEQAVYVRLTGVHTYGNGGQQDKFITASEIRVRMAGNTIDLVEQAEVTLDDELYMMDESGNPVKPKVAVTVDGTPLKYGIDYTLTYENNEKPGTATVTIKGIMKYSGEVKKEFRIISLNAQDITVVNGVIAAVEDEEFTEGSETQALSGTNVTVQAEEREGEIFDHWRCTPTALLKDSQRTEETVTFMVPDSSVRLVAVYRDADSAHVTKEVYSISDPSGWFAYANEEGLEEMLAEAMDSADEVVLARGGSVELQMNIQYSKSAFSKWDIIRSYQNELATSSNAQKATPSNAGKATASNAELATASNARKATPSDAEGAEKNPYDILNKEIPAPLRALKDEMGFEEDKDLKKTTKISFWVRTITHKITSSGGQSSSVQLTDTSLPMTEVVLELPLSDRNMANYTVYSYEFDGDGYLLTEVQSSAEGRYLTFEASADGIYAVTYTKCFDVVFEDWDGTVLSRQRVPYGEAAEEPEEPERAGYKFIGWSRDFDDVKANLKIKARYEKAVEDKPSGGTQADMSRLEKKVEEIRNKLELVNREDYTEKSWNALEKVLEEAEALLEDEEATQKAVDKLLEKLNRAYAALTKKPQKPEEPQKPEKPEEPQKPQKPGHSGGGSGSGGSGHAKASSNAPIPMDGGIYVTKGTWKETNGNWSFISEAGKQAVSEWIYTLNGDAYDWFYFDAAGNMADGWLNLDDAVFYLNPISNGKRGSMMTGWQQIDGKWYYFNEISDGTRGVLLKNTKTRDGYEVDSDGVWKK